MHPVLLIVLLLAAMFFAVSLGTLAVLLNAEPPLELPNQ